MNNLPLLFATERFVLDENALTKRLMISVTFAEESEAREVGEATSSRRKDDGATVATAGEVGGAQARVAFQGH